MSVSSGVSAEATCRAERKEWSDERAVVRILRSRERESGIGWVRVSVC